MAKNPNPQIDNLDINKQIMHPQGTVNKRLAGLKRFQKQGKDT